jgi:hypothetical protein
MTTTTTTTKPATKPATTQITTATAPGGRCRLAAQQAVDANTTHLDFHLGRTEVHVTLPPTDKLAFYAGLTGAAVFGVVEWPIALLTGVGHLLSEDRRNRTLHALGEALDAL